MSILHVWSCIKTPVCYNSSYMCDKLIYHIIFENLHPHPQNAYTTCKFISLHLQSWYCKSGNFCVTLIFARFAHFWASAKLKTRESVYFVCRSEGWLKNTNLKTSDNVKNRWSAKNYTRENNHFYSCQKLLFMSALFNSLHQNPVKCVFSGYIHYENFTFSKNGLLRKTVNAPTNPLQKKNSQNLYLYSIHLTTMVAYIVHKALNFLLSIHTNTHD